MPSFYIELCTTTHRYLCVSVDFAFIVEAKKGEGTGMPYKKKENKICSVLRSILSYRYVFACRT